MSKVISGTFFKSFFLLVVALWTLTNLAPAQANGREQPVAGGNYYVAGMTQVSGWEQGLVQNNPNLAKWHWNAIPTAIHARPTAYISSNDKSGKGANYHYAKPKVMNLPANTSIRCPLVSAKLRTQNDNSGTATAARLQPVLSYGDVQGQLRNSGQPEAYVSGRIENKELSGRVLSY